MYNTQFQTVSVLVFDKIKFDDMSKDKSKLYVKVILPNNDKLYISELGGTFNILDDSLGTNDMIPVKIFYMGKVYDIMSERLVINYGVAKLRIVINEDKSEPSLSLINS
jgi:hypothetical protein